MKPDGTRHGKATKWYDNGQKESEIELKDWMKHGKWTFWYDNGQKQLETDLDQEWICWDKTGKELDCPESIVDDIDQL
jgi:antitoxin component YwqK of YwqJK toxin-antitoxin module